MTLQETDTDLPLSAQEYPGKGWVGGGLLLSWGGTECGCACTGPFEGGSHYLHYLHHSLALGK